MTPFLIMTRLITILMVSRFLEIPGKEHCEVHTHVSKRKTHMSACVLEIKSYLEGPYKF